MKIDNRPEIPKESIIKVNNSKKINFRSKPYKFIYFDWWYNLLIIFPFILSYLLTFFAARFFGLKRVNRKNLKIMRKKGCIIVSNHCHYLDTVFIVYSMLPRYIHTAVAQRNYEIPIVRRILRMHRAFPIPATPRGLQKISSSVKCALEKKNHILILPEGELVVGSQTIHTFKTGAFMLALEHQAPIIPITYVLKRRKFMGKELSDKWLKFIQVIGEPVIPTNNTSGLSDRENSKLLANDIAAWMEKTILTYK